MKKSFVLGLLIGALLFSFLPVGAAIQEISVKLTGVKYQVNGKLVDMKNTPPVNYSNTNYAAIRPIVEAMGGSIKMDSNTNTVVINSKKVDAINVKEIASEVGKYRYAFIDKAKYISLDDVSTVDGIIFKIDDTTVLNFYASEDDKLNDIPTFNNVPYATVNNTNYVDYAFYVKNVKGLIMVTPTPAPTKSTKGVFEESAINDKNLKPILKDGLLIYDVNGIEYIANSFSLLPNKNYRFVRLEEYIFLFKADEKVEILKIPAYDNNYTILINGVICIKYSYYKDTVLPLLK